MAQPVNKFPEEKSAAPVAGEQKVEAAPSESETAKMFREFLEKLPQSIVMAQMMAVAAQNPAKAPVNNEKCPDCRQLLRACKGKHVQIVVFPSQFSQWFQGIWINGIQYLSNHANHFITVPEENNIHHEVDKYVQNEGEQAQGKTGWHNSGNLSGNGNHTIHKADGAGFR